MEDEPKCKGASAVSVTSANQKTKRKARAQQMSQGSQKTGGRSRSPRGGSSRGGSPRGRNSTNSVSGDEKDTSREESPRRQSPKPRPKAKKKRKPSSLFEEDVIDGFAIFSFKTWDDCKVRD